jgi:hypothetical protein
LRTRGRLFNDLIALPELCSQEFLPRHERKHCPNKNECDLSIIAKEFRDSFLALTPISERIDIYKHVSTGFDKDIRTT